MNELFKTKRQDGFTLVELMVVVAIIGLLSAVAVPNFKKYQARAKSTEAKLQLAALYTAETSFFSDFNMYATCLSYMGYDPTTEAASRYYVVGFNVANTIEAATYTAAQNSGLSNNAVNGCANGLAATTGRTFFPAGKGVGTTIATALTAVTTSLGNQSSSGNMTFTAAAAGYISADRVETAATSANRWSVLTINQNKTLMTESPGY